MKVLYITARPPYPPYKGDQLIAYEQLRNMPKDQVQIYLISFIDKHEDKHNLYDKLNPYCNKIYFITRPKVGSIFNIAKTIVNFLPLQVNLYANKKVKSEIMCIYEEVLPDLVHIQTIRLAEVFRSIKTPKAIDMIDALSLNMKRRAKKEKNIILKLICNIESTLLRRYEEKIIKSYDEVLMVSKKDKECLRAPKININPNGTYITEEYLEKYKNVNREKIIIFHGNMQYFPNVEAMQYFTNEIWPNIYERHPSYKLYIVGKDPSDKIRDLSKINGVVITGFVEEICEYLCKASIGVYPLNSGTGMQNKILEALACGLPSVASNLAIQGIPNITTNEIMISNTKEEYIQAIEKLIVNTEVAKQYGNKGQKFIFENYSWKKNVNKLVDIWEDVLLKDGSVK